MKEVDCPICEGRGFIEAPKHGEQDSITFRIIASHALFEHGYSVRQIARFLKVSSPNTVMYYLRKKV